jgi:hypothetical protein
LASAKTDGLGSATRERHPMDDTYQFEDHLREHRPSRLGQRLWWVPAVAGVGVVIEGGVYLGYLAAAYCRVAVPRRLGGVEHR